MSSKTTSRRQFLKETLSGVVFLFVSKFIPSEVLLANDLVPNDLLFFSSKEYLIFEAVAERIIGAASPGQVRSKDVGVAARVDQFLEGADPEVQEQIHQLLSVFNAPLFTFLFDFRTSSFLNMSPADKDSYIEDWMTSNLGFRRTGFQALKRVSMSMFYTDRRSWKEIGYEGMFMPEDRR
ncbi:hypothetical protein D4R75_10585 [bacterium]|nr:MAG: hypothetical protein D4R75_10585 [bacterium]